MVASRTPSIIDQQHFWNWHWQRWEDRRVVNEWALKRFETILEFLQSLRLTRPAILDLGCGPGFYTAQLAACGAVTAVDLSEEAIAMARKRAPQVTFFAGNIYTMPLPTSHFDVVVSQEVLSHVEDQVRYIARAAEVLKAGGHLILSTDNKFVMDRLGDVGWKSLPPEHIDAYLNIRDLKRLLRPHFQVLRTTTRVPMGQRGVLRFVNSYKLNRALELIIPARHLTAIKERAGLGFTIVAVARKRSG